MDHDSSGAPGTFEGGPPLDARRPLDALERIIIAEELASLIRHELRNNLSSIRNATFYLKRRTQATHLWEADQRVSQFFTLIEDMVVASSRVLDDRLKLKHPFARSIARVPLRECVERAAACARVPPAVDVAIDAGAGEIEADATEVAVAIRCLVENAVEATPGGTGVKVSAENVGRQFIVSIIDQGVGIPLPNRELIFDPFHTTKEGHVGLGLNIARRVARRYEGDVTLQTTTTGTCITLSLLGRAAGAERR